ncbi:unnamed protein product, partial [Effrenium voratum]
VLGNLGVSEQMASQVEQELEQVRADKERLAQEKEQETQLRQEAELAHRLVLRDLQQLKEDQLRLPADKDAEKAKLEEALKTENPDARSAHPAASALEESGKSQMSFEDFLDLLSPPEAAADDPLQAKASLRRQRLLGHVGHLLCPGEPSPSVYQVANVLAQRFVSPSQVSIEKAEYGYENPVDMANFLNAADIRLVRGAFLKKLHKLGQAMPRRQEAQQAYAGSATALVTPEEVTEWAEKAVGQGLQEAGRIVSVSHVWETREHPDPHCYQLGLLACHLQDTDWVFYDYMSLFQYFRNDVDQERSFRLGMDNMHLLYSHEGTTTARLEELTPDKSRKSDTDTVSVFSAKLARVVPVPVGELTHNATPYQCRGWCVAEREWSATRSTSNASGHLTEAKSHKTLTMGQLNREQFLTLLVALKNYPQLERLELKNCDIEVAALCEAIETSPITAVQLEGIGASKAVEAVKGLMHLEKLRVIAANACGLADAEAAILAEELKRWMRGKLELHLNNNSLGKKGLLDLAEAICSVKDVNCRAVGNPIDATELDPESEALLIQAFDASLWLDAELQKKIGPRATRAITQACYLGKLELDLGKKNLGPDGARGLADGLQGLAQLQQLSLNLRENKIGSDGARALAESLRGLAQLQQLTLDLRKNEIGLDGLRSLVEGLRGLVQLQQLTLDLECNEIGPDGARGLADGLQGLAQLQQLTLNLWGNKIGPDGARGLADGLQGLAQLQQLTLNLWNNKIGPDGARGLADGLQGLAQLQQLTLNLWGNNIGPDGARGLAEGLRGLVQLQQLKLSLEFNKIGPDGARGLAEGLRGLVQLQQLTLSLGDNKIGSDGARGLAEGLRGLVQLQQLTLSLGDTDIGPDGARGLADGLQGLAQLQQLTLSLGDNDIGSAGARGLAEGLRGLVQLQQLTLDLQLNDIGPDGARNLADGLQGLAQLQQLTLDLRLNKIGPDGARGLAEGLRGLVQLQQLEVDLRFNEIGPDGARGLAEGLRGLVQLQQLEVDLRFNEIGREDEEELRALLNALPAPKKRIEL